MTNNTTAYDEPVIDRELGLKLAGNKVELANEMLCILVESLPNDILAIQAAHTAKDYPALQKSLHKLLGAVCYCGLPRLKKAIMAFETALKQNDTTAYPKLLNEFNHEAQQVLEQATEFKD